MSLLRKSEFDCLRVAINKLKQPPLKFSKLQPNEVKRKLGPANNALESLLEKTVGLKKIDQAGLLLHHLKRIYPKGRISTSSFRISRNSGIFQRYLKLREEITDVWVALIKRLI